MDNFNLKQYLIENKMTEASRGKGRKHFVLNEGRIDKDALYHEYVSLCQQTRSAEKGARIFQKLHPDVDLERIIPRYARHNAAINNKAEKDVLCRTHARDKYDDVTNPELKYLGDLGYIGKAEPVEEYGEDFLEEKDCADDDNCSLLNLIHNKKEKVKNNYFESWGADHPDEDEEKWADEEAMRADDYRDSLRDAYLEEKAGYTQFDDDDDDHFVDDDFIGAHGSNADLGIDNNGKAEKAAKRGMKGSDLDDTADEEPESFADSDEEAEDDDFVDAEELPEKPQTAPSNITPEDVFGKNASHVEVLVDDLGEYLRGPKGRWRVNVSKNILSGAVDAAIEYLNTYDYPRKGILYLTPNKLGRYNMDVKDPYEKAVVAVHRDAIA